MDRQQLSQLGTVQTCPGVLLHVIMAEILFLDRVIASVEEMQKLGDLL
jgi:hypothetical protein